MPSESSQGPAAAEEFVHLDLGEGLTLHVWPTKQFKTVRLSAFALRPLDRLEAASAGILPLVLRRGSTRHPTALSLEETLSEMYGASLDGSTRKVGEHQAISFAGALPDETLVGERGLTNGLLALMHEFVSAPARVDHALRPDYVAQEKALQKARIKSLVNNKQSYALWRCTEEMCREEPFGTYVLGDLDTLEAVTPESLSSYHARVLQQSPIHVFVVGNVDVAEITEVVSDLWGRTAGAIEPVPPTTLGQAPAAPRRVTEDHPMSQGWLVMGWRVPVGWHDPLLYAVQVYQNLLGGGVHSLLFKHVREEAHLAYTAFTAWEPAKGIVLACAGIDPGKAGEAESIMYKQFEAVARGGFTDQELEVAKRSLLTRIRSSLDSSGWRVQHYLQGVVEGRVRSTAEMLASVARVRRDEVQKVAGMVKLDTVFFLRGTST